MFVNIFRIPRILLIWHQSEMKYNQKVIYHWVKHFLCKITLICKIVQVISIFINYRVNWEQWYYSVDVTLMVKKHFSFFVLFWFVSHKNYFWNDSNLKRGGEEKELDMCFEEHTPVIWLLTSPHRFCSCSMVPHWGHKAIIHWSSGYIIDLTVAR